jgi:hypothetical protein
MTTDDYLTVNKRIIADEFEDETVLIDVHKGLYFSMRGSAANIWKSFDEPRSKAALLAHLKGELGESNLPSVTQAIDTMVEHELLVTAPTPKSGATVMRSFAASVFALPVVDVFTDMAELIAVDPVHEVDEAAGWPVRPANFPSQA